MEGGKPPNKLLCCERNEPFPTGVRVVPGEEGDLPIGHFHEAVVRDGHLVGIESKIPEDLFGATKGLFYVHDPFLSIELLREATESILSFLDRKCSQARQGVLLQRPSLSESMNLPRNFFDKARTGARKPLRDGIHRVSDSSSPPPVTTM